MRRDAKAYLGIDIGTPFVTWRDRRCAPPKLGVASHARTPL